jgi:ketosteroid isomerase-like protein
MSEALLLDLTHRLLKAIREADWASYEELCSTDLTCFEPETIGQLVEGLDFHAFYFRGGGHMGEHQDSVVAPKVRMLGGDAAIVAYARLVQVMRQDGTSVTLSFQETRVWQKIGGQWKHVHFHRSGGDQVR